MTDRWTVREQEAPRVHGPGCRGRDAAAGSRGDGLQAIARKDVGAGCEARPFGAGPSPRGLWQNSRVRGRREGCEPPIDTRMSVGRPLFDV